MRVLQVLTWIGPGNPFGGPVRVAMNQSAELRRRGHQVELIAAQPGRRSRKGWDGSGLGVDGFDAFRLLPGTGFSGVVSPRLLKFVWTEAHRFDVIHVHLARDLVTLPAALVAKRKGVPYVLQPHGMVDPSTHPLARLLDPVLTRRVLGSAARVLVLTDRERADVAQVAGTHPVDLCLLPNGIGLPPLGPPRDSGRPDVLFCSRLHRRKRPVAFANMAASLLGEGADASFALAGPDEGELAAVSQVIARCGRPDRLCWEGALEPSAVAARLGACDALVLPSADEPFPMIVLEALAAAKPVVITEQCGLAGFVRAHGCGHVVPVDDPAALSAAVRDLIEHPDRRDAMGQAGRRGVDQDLSIASVVDQLEEVYRSASAGR